MGKKVLTVYAKPNCVKCKMSINFGKQKGYDVQVDKLFDNDGALNTVPKFYHDTYDYQTAPIVTLTDDDKLIDSWCDFRIDKLNQYAER